MGVVEQVQTCANDCDYDDSEDSKEPTFSTELCDKIWAGVKKCVGEMKIGCFSDRENTALAEVVNTALADVREMYAMDQVQNMVMRNMTVNQKDLAQSALGSGES